MRLLQQIIEEAVSRDVDVARLLRLCLVLAARLKNDQLKQWVKHELEGYPDEADLPNYRVLTSHNKGYFMAMSWRGELEIPLSTLPEELRDFYADVRFRSSIAECLDLANRGSRLSSPSLRRPWPLPLAMRCGKKLSPQSQCTAAWSEISVSEMSAVLDQVKTRVMLFALEIEGADPSAGESGASILGQEKVTQIFNTTINGGSVQNMAVGSQGVNQSIINGIEAGDLGSLFAALVQLGVPADNLPSLEIALKDDRADGGPGLGSNVKGWLSDLAIKAGTKVADKGIDSLASLAGQAVMAYLGVSG